MLSMPIAKRLPFRVARVVLPVLSLLALLAPGAPALAQDDNQALAQRVQRLESDLAILQRQVYTNGGGTGAARSSGGGGQIAPTEAASLETRVSQLESDLQTLTGRIEEIGHNVDQLKAQLDKLSKDVDFRLTALEHGGAAPGAPGSTPAPGGAGAAPPSDNPAAAAAAEGGRPVPLQKPLAGQGQVLPVGTPQQQYDYARALLVQQDYPSAEKAFSAFVSAHPEDALSGPAQYWLGETYYVRGNYDQAAKTFAEGYQRYPKSSKAPDTLLKLAMSLVQLKRNKDACVLFNELSQRYPSAPANVKQLAGRERQRAGCS